MKFVLYICIFSLQIGKIFIDQSILRVLYDHFLGFVLVEEHSVSLGLVADTPQSLIVDFVYIWLISPPASEIQ